MVKSSPRNDSTSDEADTVKNMAERAITSSTDFFIVFSNLNRASRAGMGETDDARRIINASGKTRYYGSILWDELQTIGRFDRDMLLAKRQIGMKKPG